MVCRKIVEANQLEVRYHQVLRTPSDISEHLPVLYEYATRCESVLELGVRTCVSSWAFGLGLLHNGSPVKRMVSNDLENHPNIERFQIEARLAGLDSIFIKDNDLNLDLKEEFDIVFIDTWHVYAQLKRELQKFAPMAKKYIIMHDTEVDGIHGESIRMKHDTVKESEETGFPEDEIRRGLQPAVEGFLAQNSDWKVHLVKTNNNGLTILSRN
jgi:cephalosporin hydroxylase